MNAGDWRMFIADILNCITIFQLLLLASFLFFNGKNKRANRFLAAFFIIQTFGIIDALLWRYFQWSLEHVAHVIFVPHMLSKLWGVGLMFYVMSMVSPSFKLRKIYVLHLIPMISYGVFTFFTYFRYPLSVKKEMLLQNTVYSPAEFAALVILTQLVNISYLAYTLFRLKKYASGLREYYSSTENKNLKWLQFVVFGFSFLWLVALTQYGMHILSGRDLSIINLANPIVFLLTCYIAVRGWTTPEIFNAPLEKGKGKGTNQKYHLSDLQKKSFLQQLESVMQRDKPYLDPELTLSGLSRQASIPERYLSEIINEAIGQNFYDYINGFRVRESIKYLVESPIKKNILEILLDAGFNSKTAFNVAFKKLTGMSPSEYKKINRSPKLS
jgi:AraC-like DNA-binding protein